MSNVKPLCSRCRKKPRKTGQRWCADCFAAYMRAYRKKQRDRQKARDERLAELERQVAELERQVAA